MSGEAAWLVASKFFSLALLSGVPVMDPAGARPIEQRLKARFERLVPAVEKIVEGMRTDLPLAEVDPKASYDEAPSIAGIVIEDRDGPPVGDTDPHYFKEGKKLRARLYISTRDKSSHEGFNLVIHVTARVRRSQLDALARQIAGVLYPSSPADQLVIR